MLAARQRRDADALARYSTAGIAAWCHALPRVGTIDPALDAVLADGPSRFGCSRYPRGRRLSADFPPDARAQVHFSAPASSA